MGGNRTAKGGSNMIDMISFATRVALKIDDDQYVFVANDIFGNSLYSDTATFEMTKSYDELLENPLPDGEYAAEVINIEPYNITE